MPSTIYYRRHVVGFTVYPHNHTLIPACIVFQYPLWISNCIPQKMVVSRTPIPVYLCYLKDPLQLNISGVSLRLIMTKMFARISLRFIKNCVYLCLDVMFIQMYANRRHAFCLWYFAVRKPGREYMHMIIIETQILSRYYIDYFQLFYNILQLLWEMYTTNSNWIHTIYFFWKCDWHSHLATI